MKTSLKAVLTVAAMSLMSVGAQAAPSCSFDASGTFHSKNGKIYQVTQSGCQVNVAEIRQQGGNLHWSFDLTGNTTAGIAPEYIAEVKAKAAPEETERLQSEVIRTTVAEYAGFAVVDVSGTMTIPKSSSNPFEIQLTANAKAYAYFQSSASGGQQLASLHVQQIQARLASIQDSYYTGTLGAAFLAGANYVLRNISFDAFTDDVELTRAN